jgi:hypothetical protein
MEGVYDFFLGNINNIGSFSKEAAHVLAKTLALFLLDQHKVHPSTMTT